MSLSLLLVCTLPCHTVSTGVTRIFQQGGQSEGAKNIINFPFFSSKFARIFRSFLYFLLFFSTFLPKFCPNFSQCRFFIFCYFQSQLFAQILPEFFPYFAQILPAFCPNFWLPFFLGGGGGTVPLPLPPASYAYALLLIKS